MERFRKMFSLNTIQKKCMVAILVISFLITIISGLCLPNIFYQVLKPYIINNISLALEGTATKISYVLNQNTQYHRAYYNNEKLIKLVNEYENSKDSDKQKISEEIGAFFRERVWGKAEPGSIQNKQDMGLILNGKELFAKPELKEEMELVLHSAWYRKYYSEIDNMKMLDSNGNIDPTKSQRMYSNTFEIKDNGEFNSFIAYCYHWKDGENTFDTVMIQSLDYYKKIMQEFQNINNTDIALLNGNQILCSSKETSFFEELPGKYPQEMFQGNQYELKQFGIDESMNFVVLVSYRIEEITLAVHITEEELIAPWQHLILVVQIFIWTILILVLITISLILQKNLKNLKRLSAKMEKVQQGNWNERSGIQTDDEVGRLSATFDSVMIKLEDNIKEILEKEKREEQIQYSLLVSQIDPHFIYNTLNTITYLAKLNRVNDIVKINLALIITLKDRLKIKQYQSFDTIENEKNVLEQYILIQNYLCTNSIVFTFLFDPHNKELEIPKNILQPLVENSILHGLLLNRDEDGNLLDGEIKIEIEKDSNGVEISIKDNGIGMSERELEKYFINEPNLEIYDSQKESHIGIYNIRMRLAYLYNNQYKISAYLNENGGITIKLFLPENRI